MFNVREQAVVGTLNGVCLDYGGVTWGWWYLAEMGMTPYVGFFKSWKNTLSGRTRSMKNCSSARVGMEFEDVDGK